MPTLKLTDSCTIPAAELECSFARSSGPGGQNVNKVASKVELRFQLAASKALTPARKARLAAAFPSHVTSGGEFVLSGDRFRSQRQNQEDVLERLRAMVLSVWLPPKPRVKTKVSKAAQRRRVGEKRKRGDIKRQRSTAGLDS
jgi:ribosome-associated protein